MLLISGPTYKSQMKLDLDRRIYIDWFTVQDIRPVSPFLNCINRGLNQNRVALHNLDVYQVSFSINCGLQEHITLNPVFLGFSWVVRRRSVNLEAVRDP